MKKIPLLTILFSALLLIGAGCQYQTEEPPTPLPPAVDELQTQTVPEIQKQDVRETPTDEPASADVVLYNGTWFDIEYPDNFTASPTTPTNIYNGLESVFTDEATFTSPDGAVEFFVYSPLRIGNPASYLETSETEELVSEKTDEGGSGYDKTIVRWVTVKAKDGSYFRSFVSIRGQVGFSEVHHVFGIKYKDNASYKQFRDAYASFKESLNQYSD